MSDQQSTKSNKPSFLHQLAPYIYKCLMLLITASCRVKVHGKQHIDKLQNSHLGNSHLKNSHLGNNSTQGNWIYSIWHNNVLLSPWALKNQGVTVMISESKDGEIIARSVKMFGNDTIRGSSSKSSTKVTRQALKALKNNSPIAITPDGPRGPKYILQEGVLFLAALSKTPIVPFHVECTRQWQFNSWDNLKLPKPFSTIHCCYGEPIHIDRKQLEQDKEKVKTHIQQLMLDNVEFALQQARTS